MYNKLSRAKKLFPVIITVTLICTLFLPTYAYASENIEADVAVIVDTSTSMKGPGMDPERASLLVTKLLTDIVPGNLAVIRLLDIGNDKDLLPSKPTNKSTPCSEDITQSCNLVEQASDWPKEAREKQFGATVRPMRGDLDYKKKLEHQLLQISSNSMFDLAFQSALGIFDKHQKKSPRTIIWLSDGHSDHEAPLKPIVKEIKTTYIGIEAIVFGAGDTRLAHELGLEATKVSSPAEIMKAFANSFRRIVKAPYRVDNLLSMNPNFEMKRNTQEAWVVVYGDQTLGDVSISSAGISQKADYAQDIWPTAGAYKVAYLQHPVAGQWQVKADGGGQGVAYAVIQRSELKPVLLEPKQTLANTPVALVAGLGSGAGNQIITDPELLQNTVITVTVEGKTLSLQDNGQNGDKVANDGRFTGLWTFSQAGDIPLQIQLKNEIAESMAAATVNVTGVFSYKGGPLEIDLGSLGVNDEACRPVSLHADHQGELAFELKSLKSLPSDHALSIHAGNKVLLADGNALPISPNDTLQVCLSTQGRAVSSDGAGEAWLLLQLAGNPKADQQVTFKLNWHVQGLSFWALWGWLIEIILLGLVVVFIVMGFIWPQRFRKALALTFVPERDELDEQTPQPVKQWQGVGIGFYRHARAYLHADYRLSGKAKGALAGLFANPSGNKVMACNGNTIYRETLDGDWEAIPQTGGNCRPGDVFRVGANGPYFRISVRG